MQAALLAMLAPEVVKSGCAVDMTLDSAYTSKTGHGVHVGNPTCKQKTLDVGKSVSLAQADGQYSPGCSVLANMALS